jgi:hypothetical protein
MAHVLTLDSDVEYPNIYGIISDLPSHKMCAQISHFLGHDLVHEDALLDTPPPITEIVSGEMITFEKFIWVDTEAEAFFYLINNRVEMEGASPVSEENTLFQTEETQKKTYFLLPEWKKVSYLVHTEGLENIIEIDQLKSVRGIRFVMKEPINKFKKYSKIL